MLVVVAVGAVGAGVCVVVAAEGAAGAVVVGAYAATAGNGAELVNVLVVERHVSTVAAVVVALDTVSAFESNAAAGSVVRTVVDPADRVEDTAAAAAAAVMAPFEFSSY